MTSLKERLRTSITRRSAQESPLFNARREAVQTTKSEVELMKTEIMAEMRRILEEKIGQEGITTITGKPGIKGEKGDKGDPGPRGADGLPGKDAQLGDIEKIITHHIKAIPKDKLDINALAKDIARALESLKGADRLDYKALKNTPVSQENFGGIHRGGGTNILTTASTVDDSNTTFVFTSIPKIVVVNGASYINGAGVTITGTTVTLDNPPGVGGSVYALA